MFSYRKAVLAVLGALASSAVLFAQPAVSFADELTIAIPALGVSAPVETIGLVDGSLDTPSGPDAVGALQLTGNLLVVGHRDWSGQLRSFGHLEALQAGDEVSFSDGRAYSVETTSVWDIDGEQDIWAAAIAPGHGDVLTLISCTGPFSVSRHEYLERIVVHATRID